MHGVLMVVAIIYGASATLLVSGSVAWAVSRRFRREVMGEQATPL